MLGERPFELPNRHKLLAAGLHGVYPQCVIPALKTESGLERKIWVHGCEGPVAVVVCTNHCKMGPAVVEFDTGFDGLCLFEVTVLVREYQREFIITIRSRKRGMQTFEGNTKTRPPWSYCVFQFASTVTVILSNSQAPII